MEPTPGSPSDPSLEQVLRVLLTDFLPQGLLTVAVLALAVRVARTRPGAPRGRLLAIASAQQAVFLALFVSLAAHMHASLGGWPSSLGTNGFPEPLIVHASAAFFLFASLFLGLLFVLPAGLVLCALVERLRPGLPALGLWAAMTVMSFLAMTLAPEPFLDWWMD